VQAHNNDDGGGSGSGGGDDGGGGASGDGESVMLVIAVRITESSKSCQHAMTRPQILSP